ncbi:fused isobutyryl-CoA mutase/GTPase IcmF [Streptosporangium roseum]|uniref:Fused isobutyryl-CoA mutase n=1 Tax=Streptosporangium roseum (strain ATCC 12428 / DSM 43021 / JCM 3005 / KCTC 9067 / NCIMB 10171 / NRRL 2505 / NI 9100) TaxID=479432 RepID=D2AQU3_STRRD|nr:fused isobutyryl-CoA mutase/GTPase IcmF [Streptosporangium roseum]ACZ86490.1 Methylmalonyl-CoA mutase [Streptosporangium roseum DSM 43021]
MHVPAHPVRVVTAAALFDGHDAAINIMRRILQAQGAEVIHLGHNRSVDEIVTAAIQEDVQGVAISSYQGGHVEFFTYLVDLLRERGAGHVKVYGGGGGVIVREEIDTLHAHGVAGVFSPEDGQRLGLAGMINKVVEACDVDLAAGGPPPLAEVVTGDHRALARAITTVESGVADAAWLQALRSAAAGRGVPVLGITGTGGSGKSSLTDELLRRIRIDSEDKLRVAVIAVDPTRRRGGGALLGDRIRMNSLAGGGAYFRSLATRGAQELPAHLGDVIAACQVAGHDLVIVETPGIGQGDAAIVPFADVSLYVMTPEFGAASQLEKIDMLDFADVVAINKYERRGAEDALRDVRRQMVRNREAFGVPPEEMPVYGTIASRFNDAGVTALYQRLRDLLGEHGLPATPRLLPEVHGTTSEVTAGIVPPARSRYLAEIADTVRGYHAHTGDQAEAVRRHQRLAAVRELVAAEGADTATVDLLLDRAAAEVDPDSRALLEGWSATADAYQADELVVKVRDRELRTPLWRPTLSGNRIPRVALPRLSDHGDLLRFLRAENLPGSFPFTAGVFPFKRDDEDPTRMFAGEGDPFRTNRRFKLLSEGQPATRLSTAFDSVTLYGNDPALRPDIYGKVGTSGVSIATLDDMKTLYDGFDLSAPNTSVSMTINGPAPTILAFFLNAALDQALGRFRDEHGREPAPDEAALLRARTLATVRGTVQADILKEDQGQNTCIFSTEFSLRMMADIQEWFIANGVRNFYSVSISGYHIAEAGANPISQLAFTLANGFTYVEAYLARGMKIDDFAPNLSFFFSNGMDPEYSVLGRVARRIWAVALKERYGAAERAQKLKYHIQTSGRSLHAQEMDFNDIRTTLQALTAIYDNCNSLHTNAFDEAVTTPSPDSVRRAMAIQLIINREWGLAVNENPLQGSFIVDELTDLVEEAVLREFERISDRGGVLGAMETGYQRGRIQDESMLYETRKHDGSLPIIGVNTFRNPRGEAQRGPLELARGTEEEKRSQLDRLRGFQEAHAEQAPQALQRLRRAAMSDENAFAVLMDAARVCSLGQITEALFEAGGQYRRNV